MVAAELSPTSAEELSPLRDVSPRARLWIRFRRHRLALVGLAILALIIFGAIFAPYLTSYDPLSGKLLSRYQPPSADHLLGTDGNGRDILARILFGARVSLAVGIGAVSLSALIGIVIGGIAGYFGGSPDLILMRITDIFLTLPLLVIVISLVAIIGPGTYSSLFAIGVLSWTSMARLVRGQFLTLRSVEYVEAARALGEMPVIIILRHVLPNAFGPIAVAITFALGEAILLEAALSFFGLGVQVPTPSWGSMLSDARTISILETRPWMWLPPGVMIVLTVLSINFIGDGLRDALDPQSKPA